MGRNNSKSVEFKPNLKRAKEPIASFHQYEDGSVESLSFKDRVTTVIVAFTDARGIGVAKCMPGDHFSREVGQGIATARAIKNLADDYEKLWLGRSVTEDDWKSKHPNKA